MFIERFYRDLNDTPRWKTYRVKVETSDLYIRSSRDLSMPIRKAVMRYRREIESHIKRQPEFLTSFEPVKRLKGVCEIIKCMYSASEKAGVGPMAAVAGAIAMFVGRDMRERCREMVIENGGDVYVHIQRPLLMSVFAPDSPFNGKIALKLAPSLSPCGVCTSSATVGHSMSFGRADAFTVIAQDVALADAVATGGCNRVCCERDIEDALEYALGVEGVMGAFVIYGKHMGAKGAVEFAPIK